jgi:hypothetical protein
MRASGLMLAGLIVLLGTLTSAHAAPISPLNCANPGSTTASQSDTSIHANSCTDFSFAFPNSPQPAAGTNNWLYGYLLASFDPASFIPMTQQVVDPTTGQPIGVWANQFDRYFTSQDAFGGHANGEFTDYHIPPYCNDALYQNCSPNGGLDPRSPNSPGSSDQKVDRRYIVPSAIGTTTVDINIQVQKDPRTSGPTAHGTINYVILYHNGVATTLITLVDPVNFNPNLPGAPPTSQGIPQPILSASATNVTIHGGDYIDFIMSTAPDGDPAHQGKTVDFSSGTFTLDTITSSSASAVPEPLSVSLMAAGVLLLALFRKLAGKH